MKLSKPGIKPISRPKFSPISVSADGVERAEDQADQRLPAHEAGDRVVDVAGEPAHRVAVLQRNPAVDRGDHAVPVESR